VAVQFDQRHTIHNSVAAWVRANHRKHLQIIQITTTTNSRTLALVPPPLSYSNKPSSLPRVLGCCSTLLYLHPHPQLSSPRRWSHSSSHSFIHSFNSFHSLQPPFPVHYRYSLPERVSDSGLQVQPHRRQGDPRRPGEQLQRQVGELDRTQKRGIRTQPETSTEKGKKKRVKRRERSQRGRGTLLQHTYTCTYNFPRNSRFH